MSILANYYRAYTDVGNHNDNTLMSLYSLYGDLSDDSMHILIEVTLGISKFRNPYRPLDVFSSHYYSIPPFKRVKNVKPFPTSK